MLVLIGKGMWKPFMAITIFEFKHDKKEIAVLIPFLCSNYKRLMAGRGIIRIKKHFLGFNLQTYMIFIYQYQNHINVH